MYFLFSHTVQVSGYLHNTTLSPHDRCTLSDTAGFWGNTSRWRLTGECSQTSRTNKGTLTISTPLWVMQIHPSLSMGDACLFPPSLGDTFSFHPSWGRIFFQRSWGDAYILPTQPLGAHKKIRAYMATSSPLSRFKWRCHRLMSLTHQSIGVRLACMPHSSSSPTTANYCVLSVWGVKQG